MTQQPLPPRTADTMSEAIAMSSPSGRISKGAARAAEKRLSQQLFGPGGLQQAEVKQPAEVERLERQANELESLAERGMKPRANKERAAELRHEAAVLRGEKTGEFLVLTKKVGFGGAATAGSYQTVEATPVKELEAYGIDGFVHRDIINPKQWTVTEGKTGGGIRTVTQGLTKTDAIKLAVADIDEYERINGKGSYLKLIDDTVKRIGLSPRYGRIPPTFKETSGLKGLQSTDLPSVAERKAFVETKRMTEVKPSIAMPPLLRKKEAAGVSIRAAAARASNPRAGVSQGQSRRPDIDNQRTAKVVAPAVAKTEADLKLQRKWFKHPNQLDFEGIDTAPSTVKPRRMKRTKL